MKYVFNKSSIGFNHLKDRKVCQDYSALYKDNNRIIITCCDGHGGKLYSRSDQGAKFASYAIINVFNSLELYYLSRGILEEIIQKIKLQILCEWNRMVENHLSYRPIRKSELIDFTEDDIESIKANPVRLYGTTLLGAMYIGNKLVIVGIGDSECLGIKNGKLERLLEDEDEPVGNYTYSMCQEDAFSHLKVRILENKDYDGILLCTDGLTRPYQSYSNFNESFVKPMVSKVLVSNSLLHIDTFIEELSHKLGVGDDVSLAFILNSNIQNKYYL